MHEDFQHLSPSNAKSMLDQGNITIVDIRDTGSYEDGHIAGAVHVSNDNIEEFLETADKRKPLVVYCYHGNSSQGAASFFKEKGFGEVYSLDGGFEDWRQRFPYET